MNDGNLKNNKKNNIDQKKSEEEKSKDNSVEERIKEILNELTDLINTISNSRQLGQSFAQSQEFISNLSSALNHTASSTEAGTRSTQIMDDQNQKLSDVKSNIQVTTNQQVDQGQTNSIGTTLKATIFQIDQTLVAINSIKTELCRLPLDFCEREYITNCVIPLETSMEFVSRASYELATSASILTTSPIVPRKKEKLKDTLHTVYSMNEEVEELYHVLKKRLEKLTRGDNCCNFP